MIDAATFWDKVAVKYAAQPISDEDAYKCTLNKTRGYLKATDRALEVGCGTGSTALLLSDCVAHITGSDVSGKMIEIAKGKAEAQGIRNVDFVQADIMDASFNPEPYDVVLAHNILHLLDQPADALNGLAHQLKSGGIFISKTVCTLGSGTPFKWRLLKLILPIMQFFGKAPYVEFRSAEAWESMIRGAGFDIIESGNFPASALSRYIVARKL
jgi:ubiquinone/menaquinone biosynthesis C-methylase UbiE